MKKIIKNLLTLFFGNKFLFIIYYYLIRIFKKKFIVAVTYHDTPISSSNRLLSHFNFFNKYFSNCSKTDLELFLKTGEWNKSKPGIIISFDDGLLSNYEVAKPLLEKFQFSGWFMIPAKIIELKLSKQHIFAEKAKILENFPKNKKRIFMSKHEIKILDSDNHHIVNHSYSHPRLSSSLSKNQLEKEIVFSKIILEKIIMKKISSFAWVGGEEYAFSKSAYDKILDSQYNLVFSTNCCNIYPRQNNLCLERFHLDAHYSLSQVYFSISWIYSLFYWNKRRRIFNLLFN